MSSYLICATPAHGHVAPLLTIARHLLARGDQVRFLTGAKYRDAVDASGAEFVPIPPDADIDLDRAGELFPERARLSGAAGIRFDMRTLFLKPARAQYEALCAELDRQSADAILTEGLFLGAAILGLRPREERPPIVALGIFPLSAPSRDTAPFGVGMTPLAGAAGRIRNHLMGVLADRVIFGSVLDEADAVASALVGAHFHRSFLSWTTAADALVQFTTPSFEYPRSDLPSTVSFAGPLPWLPPRAAVLPEWWGDLDGGRPIVHVTQGTVANTDLTSLIRPTIDGLADRDVLVLVSTGGRPLEALGSLPANVRASTYLPYGELFPRLDVLVTNGGYGGVQQALAHGIPLVVAGQTEDKIEVTARVGWSGAGINLRTNAATPAKVARAVDAVLRDPSYRSAAQWIGAEMRSTDALGALTRVLDELAHGQEHPGAPTMNPVRA